MSSIEDALHGFSLLDDVAPDHLSLLAEGASTCRFSVDERIVERDRPADAVYALQSGRVAIELASPNRGPLIIETVGAGDIVGISWILPPYRWAFDARALDAVSAIALDAARLRRTCEENPDFGYAVYKRFAALIHHRLVATRVRVLDLYGIEAT